MPRLNWADGELTGKNYLLGDTLSVADAYLFLVTGWGKHVGINIAGLTT